MKPNRLFATAITLVFFASLAHSQQSLSGDVWRWLPFENGAKGKDAQIVRNAQYVSIKIQAAHVSYRSGFLENIRQIVVSSNVSFDLASQKIQALSINRTWQKSRESDDSIPVNDLLAVLSPASPNSITIKMTFAGIGESRFKGVFDLLATNDVKTALNLSPASIAQAGLVTSIVQKFLATPYTSNNPKDVLSMSQGFVIYPDKDLDRVDSLRQGYIVVISGSEKKSGDLDRVTKAPSDSIRFSEVSHALEIKQPDGSWVPFTGNSYVVLSVTVDSVRGTDEASAWFKKFSEGDRTTENLLTGDAVEKVRKSALALWQEGSTLLSADANYIESERKKIRLAALADIENDLKKHGAPAAEADLSAVVPGVPANLQVVATEYRIEAQRANLKGLVTIHLRDWNGNALSGTPIIFTDTATGQVRKTTTDVSGDTTITALNASSYQIEATPPGFDVIKWPNVTVQPRETKEVHVEIPKPDKIIPM